jgi:hypothetical protein
MARGNNRRKQNRIRKMIRKMNKVTTLLHNKAEADKDTFAVFAVAAVCV